MKGECLRIYVDEARQHHGVLLWEWLLKKASALGIRGGSAFRAIGGFGHHHDVHESRFFELAGTTGICVEFIVDDGEAEKVISLVREEGIRVVFARMPVCFDVINQDVG